MNTIFQRTSIRAYQDKPVEQEKIEQILRAAMAAPSAGNQQPWEFYVVTDKATIERLSTAHPYARCVKGAPLAIVMCIRKPEGLRWPVMAPQDMGACAENLLLEVEDLGLGACWTGVYPEQDRMDNIRAILNLPETLDAFALVPVGYPAESKKQQDRYDTARIHYVG